MTKCHSHVTNVEPFVAQEEQEYMAMTGRRLTRAERVNRAEKIMSLRMSGLRFVDIAPQFNVTPSLISMELKWFLHNAATQEQVSEFNESMRSSGRSISPREIDRRFSRTRQMMDYIMSGHTLVQTAEHFSVTAGAVSKSISSYERFDPEAVREYREIAGTHRFGHYRNQDGSVSSERSSSSNSLETQKIIAENDQNRPKANEISVSRDDRRISNDEFRSLVDEVLNNLSNTDSNSETERA